MGRELILVGLVAGLSWGCAPSLAFRQVEWQPLEIIAVQAFRAPGALSLSARRGTIHVDGADTDSIRVRARVGSPREGLGRAECPISATRPVVVFASVSDGLSASLSPEPAAGCAIEWNVVVPRAMAVKAQLEAGSIQVDGLWAEARLITREGNIRATVSGAEVYAKTHAGDISVDMPGDQVGSLDLSTRVGNADLFLNGARLKRGRSPGVSDHLRTARSSGHPVTLKAHVGNVRLNLLSHPSQDEKH